MCFCKPRDMDEEDTWENKKRRRENRLKKKQLALARIDSWKLESWEKQIMSSFSFEVGEGSKTEKEDIKILGKEKERTKNKEDIIKNALPEIQE